VTNPVIKAASYCLFHAPDMVLTHGTTLMIERDRSPDSPLLTAAKEALRPFEEVVAYPPNQVYIGNLTPEELAELPQPWYENPVEAQRAGRLGEIFPLDELIAMMKISDSFSLVLLAEEFAQGMVEKLADHPLFTEQDLAALQKAQPLAEIQELLEKANRGTPGVSGPGGGLCEAGSRVGREPQGGRDV